MGWWSLGPEDEESIEMPPPLPVRRARGGAGRVPDRKNTASPDRRRRKTRSRSPRKSKRSKSPTKKKKRTIVVGGPQEEQPNLFASIGRMMVAKHNKHINNIGNISDVSTLGTAKYPGENGIPIEAFNNANEAQRRANEMANAMAWLSNPTTTTSATLSQTNAAADDDLFQDSENWWESAEDNNAPENSSSSLLLEPEEMPDLMALLRLGRNNNGNNNNNNSVMDALESYKKVEGKELSAELKAKELQRSMQWLQNNHTKYDHEELLEEYSEEEEPFQKVAGYGQLWKLKRSSSINWERYYDLMENRKQAQRLAKNLKHSLVRFLNDDDDTIATTKRLKDLFLDWKFRVDDNDGAAEETLEETLSWWKLHAPNYDPVTASDEETDKFLESKRLLALLGWKEDDDLWDKRYKEMEESLALWRTYKKKKNKFSFPHDLDDLSIEKIKKVQDVLVQINRDGITGNDMTYMATEMNKILTWYIDNGYKITEDLSKVNKSYQSKFQKAQALLNLWVKQIEPMRDGRLQDIVEMLKALEQNKYTYSTEIVEKYNGEKADRFRKLQEAMMNWKVNTTGSISGDGSNTTGLTEVAMDEAAVCNSTSTIESVLDWWVANGEHFDFQTAASDEEVHMAQVARGVLDVWLFSSDDSGDDDSSNFCYSQLAAVVEEIKDGIAVYHSLAEEPEQLQDLATEIEIKRRQQRDSSTPISWVRKKEVARDTTTTDNSEPLDVVENPKSKFHSVAPTKALSDEEKRAQEMSSALDWLRRNDTELDVDDEMSVALSIATFKKIDILMPKTGDSSVPTTMDGALEWLRSRTAVDDDTVSSFKKIDDVLTRSGAFDTIKEGGFTGALEWLRGRHAKKTASDLDVESTSFGSHIKNVEMFSAPKSNVDRRAEQMNSALDWLRSSEPDEVFSVGSDPVSLHAGISSVGNILNVNRVDGNSLLHEDALDGVRFRSAKTTEQSSEVAHGASGEYVASCSSSPDAEHERATEVTDHAMCFRRSKATSHSTDGPDEISELNTMEAFVPVSLLSNTKRGTGGVGAEQTWRRNTPQDDRPDDIDVALVNTELVKPKSSEEDGVLQADDEMEWSRTETRDPKQRLQDLETIVQWMRKGKGRGQEKEDKYDPTGDFRTVDSLLSHRPGQDKTTRARMIEGALDWCRRRDHRLDGAIAGDEVFEKINLIPIASQPFGARTGGAPVDLGKNVWMRERSSDSEMPVWEPTVKMNDPAFSGHCNKTHPKEMRLDWMRSMDSIIELRDDDTLLFKRPCDVNCIPRDDSPTDVNDDDMSWTTHINRLIPVDDEERESCQEHGLLNFIPRSPEDTPEDSQECQNDHWVRHPGVEAKLDEETLCFKSHTRNVESIPREGPPADEKMLKVNWFRDDKPANPIAGEDHFFDGPLDIWSIPRTGSSHHEAKAPELSWSRNPAWKMNGTEIGKRVFSRPSDVRSIPRSGELNEEMDPFTGWNRIEDTNRESEENAHDRLGDLRSIPRDGSNDEQLLAVSWGRGLPSSRQGFAETADDFDSLRTFNRPGGVNSIPRDGTPRETDDPEMNWSRHNSSVAGYLDEEFPFDTPGMLNSIPTSREDDEGPADDNLDWVRHPGVGTWLDEENLSFERPGDIESIPRSGLPMSKEEPGTDWARRPNKSSPGVEDDAIPFYRPGLNSVPKPRESDDKGTGDNLDWTRYPNQKASGVPDEEISCTKPGDVRSIPRYGENNPEEDSEFMWTRHVPEDEHIVSPSKRPEEAGDEDKISRIRSTFPDYTPTEEDVIGRPGDLRSIPRTGKPKTSEHPELGWVRKVVPGVPEDDDVIIHNSVSGEENVSDIFERPGDIRSIPRALKPYAEGRPELSWNRNPAFMIRGVPREESAFDLPGDLRSIPRPNRVHDEDYQMFWDRNAALKTEKPFDEKSVFDRPGDLRSIPRIGRPHDQGYTEIFWDRNPLAPTQQRPGSEENVFDRPGDLRSIPRDGRPRDENYPETTWARNPLPAQRPGSEENVFYRPGDLRSIPRDGRPHDEDYPETTWARNPLRAQRPDSEENVFDRPGGLRSIPRDGRPHDENYPETTWARNPLRAQRPDSEENAFDRPGDLRSIPRGGRPRDENYPETTWCRNPLPTPEPRRGSEEKVFDRPGDIRSIPRDGRPKDSDDSEFEWKRAIRPPLGIPGSENVYDRPGNPRSIPRGGRPKESDDPELNWERNFGKSISIFHVEEPFDRPPVESRLTPRDGPPPSEEEEYGWQREPLEDCDEEPEHDWYSDKPEDAQWKKEKPGYNWSGGRPGQLRAAEPDFDWSSEKPEDGLWKKEEPLYDWKVTSREDALWSKVEPDYDWYGARPFERPREITLETLPTKSLDDGAWVPTNEPGRDISDFATVIGEEKPRPVAGVPCAAWTMLALGATAGTGMAAAGKVDGVRVTTSAFATNGSGSSSNNVWPEPGSLPNCSTDANCQIVMDGLSPVLPPDVLGLFDLPGTCQSKARDWLRTGKDILEFKAERIRQRYAMSVFFCEMDGGDWIEGDSWLSDLHECDWYNRVGLDPCNRREQMEMLRVTDNGLAGTLPVEMFILSNLYEFTLANNLISGSLPQLFDKFKELDTLVIPFNQFEGSLPHQIWEYPDMVYLDVAYNGFSGAIPADIDTRMPNLNVAFFENNKLSGPIPETMGNLKRLQRLHLDDNKFTGTVPSTLGQPPRLSELLLHDNLLTGQVPKQLGDLNRLQLLTLHYNSFDEQTIDEHICNLVYNEQMELATVDKEIIDCGCCSSGEESFV